MSRDRGSDYAAAANGSSTLPLSEQILAAFWSILLEKVALPMINSEQILAVIPNSEAILCHHLKSSEQAYDVPQYITHQKMPLLPQIGR